MSSQDRTHDARTRIDEELVCVDSLKHVLCARCGCNDVRTHREQDDPPDFTVTVGGESFPAEVTSIVSNQQYHAHCTEFAKAIHDRATSLGVLSGKYAFTVSRLPRIPKPASRDGRRLLDVAVAYIEATRYHSTSGETQLGADKSGKISITKLSPTGSAVGLVWSAPAMWEGDIQSQLTTLIQRSVDDKKRKLQDVGIEPGKALLLLYDAFAYALLEDAVAALRQVSGYEWFHSVFWAASFSDRVNATYPSEPGREGFFLFSRKPEWDKVGTIALQVGT